jgi:E3 SUMO-protein ligase PIAS1
MNGHAPTNGYSSSSQFGALHQPAPPRTPLLHLPTHTATKNDTGPAAPTYFFKDSPFFQVRELILSNITLEGTSIASRSPQWC